MKRLTRSFFQRDPVSCARELVGCHFRWDGCEMRIVETEAYDAVGDEACHTWLRQSSRDFIERHRAGDAYVYLNYGVHWLFNILVKGPERSGFVLLRAGEPVGGIEEMRERRGSKFKDPMLAAGPGRLTQALGIHGEHHGEPFLRQSGRGFWQSEPVETVSGPRIGISKAVDLPWRFGDASSNCLSRAF
ncbi:MAG: DNA-3-methyladenine glycosylase [Akkermansiaceae bacterium]|nr:DNA-3-methyladenine glycosylase [Akkermansiaceae bacterium]